MSFRKYKRLLNDRGFQAFLWTQFFGALNDNLYKMVISLFAVDITAAYGGSSLYLSLTGAIFILPFFLFSGYAGYVSDVFSKRSVLITMKGVEVVVMFFAFLAFKVGRIELMLAVLFLMALQSTFFSPAKYGIIPEMVPYKDLSRANGLLEMSTFFAIILGISSGSMIFWFWKDQVIKIGFIVVAIAITGAMVSLGISRVPASGSRKSFSFNPWSEIIHGMRRIYRDRILWLTVVGATYFWFLGALLQMDILLLGKEVMGLDDKWIGIMVAFIAIGIGVGSIVSGRLSGDRIEPALVPLGSIGMVIFSILIYYFTSSYMASVFILMCLGFSGGLFIVPLSALIQQKSGKEEKGRIIATNNFLNTGGIIVASLVLYLLRDTFQIGADRILQILGIITFVITVYIIRILPDFLMRFILWLLIHTVYRIRVHGEENIATRSGVLLFANYNSIADPFLIGASLTKYIRFVIPQYIYTQKGLQWFFRLMKTIPISEDNVLQALDRVEEELRQGNHVCIFIEGMKDPNGVLKSFKEELEKRTDKFNVPFIPVYLGRPGGRMLWRWKVGVFFGKTISDPFNMWGATRAIMETGCESLRYRRSSKDILPYKFIKTAKRRWFSFCMADSTGKELTYGKALSASILLARWLKERSTGPMIGVLLPASTAGGLANTGITMASMIPVNLNFKAGKDFIYKAMEKCNISTILTSRGFLSKTDIDRVEGMIFIEDFIQEVSFLGKFFISLMTLLAPSVILKRILRLKQKPFDLATVVFSSGTTGEPKGVMLSHHNIISNIEGLVEVFPLTKSDKIMGVLPFFHSFGLTGSLWFPLLSGIGAVYHANPVDARIISRMINTYAASILLSTPTFLYAYMNRCTSEEFSTLRYVIVGAEKLSLSFQKKFKSKFNIDIFEGYGCTEMGPVISVNAPDIIGEVRIRKRFKPGTVGRPLSGLAIKVVDIHTGKMVPPGKEGMLLVKGGGQMMGYLGEAKMTRKVLRDGWYVTGDIGKVDEDGFISITDRISRFSKIGGEMVPHLKIEEVINGILIDGSSLVLSLNEEGEERLVALYTDNNISSREIWEKLCATDIPRLWIPRRENIFYVEAIPYHETGKIDMSRAKALVKSLIGDKNNQKEVRD